MWPPKEECCEMSIGVNHEMEGQSAMMPLGASAGAPVECDMMVPSKAAQGNPRMEGVSCAAYQSTDV